MSSAAALVANAFVAGFRPEPNILVSDWADEFRMVGKPSPAPGPWRTWRVPYTKEPMDRLSPSDPCEILALMKAAQGAGTEIGQNAVGCWMHKYPDSAMIIQPTIGAAKRFKHIRFDRMVEATPALRALVAPPRSREASNTAQLLEFGEGRDSLVFVGANSGVDLRSYPSRYMFADEIDGYPADVDGEGSPIDLLIQRTGAMANRKIFLCSTPTLDQGSHIAFWFKAGDQNRYFVPCPLCTRAQTLIFGADRFKTGEPGGLRWPKGEPSKARYQCEHCGDLWEEWQKVEALQRGEWRPSAPGNGAGKIRSYHMNALIYPYGWPENSWANLARQWDRSHANPVSLKTFVNLKLGEPWKDPAELAADADALFARRESYGPELPAGVAILVAGADIQKNRIEVEVLGVGAGEETWSIEYRVLAGDTSRADGQVWRELDDLLKGEWLSETGLTLGIRAACVDASYQQDLVRKWCHERRARNIWAVIGRSGQDRPAWPTKAPKPPKWNRPAPAVVLGVDSLKETVYARLALPEPGPGYCHFSTDRTKDQLEMLVSEQRVADYSGPIPTFSWQKKVEGSRNEWLDIRGYEYGALRGLEFTTAFRLDQEVENFRKLVAVRLAPEPEPAPAAPRESWFGGRGDGWLRR